MVVGCANVWDFITGGGNCFLFNSCAGVCDFVFCGVAVFGDWAAVYVAASRKYRSIDSWYRIKDRMEMEKVI